MRRFFSGRGYLKCLFQAYPVARTTRQLEIIDTELYVVSLDRFLYPLFVLMELCVINFAWLIRVFFLQGTSCLLTILKLEGW